MARTISAIWPWLIAGLKSTEFRVYRDVSTRPLSRKLLIRRLLAGERVTLDGEFSRLDDALLRSQLRMADVVARGHRRHDPRCVQEGRARLA